MKMTKEQLAKYRSEYRIDVPPPTISGLLHLGHVYSYAQMDFIARYHQMKRRNLVYPFCYDNNGLPTAALAAKEGITDPDAIAIHSIQVSKDYRKLFNHLGMAYTGAGYETYYTVAQQIADLSFNDLLRQDLVYKAETEYLYCPKMQTSVAMSEVDENGIYERSGEKVIKKMGEGWFIRVKDHLSEIRSAVEHIHWHPEMYRDRLLAWLDGVEYDWSISRERKYGVVMKSDPKYVYDTWYISSLTPQLAYAQYSGEVSLECPIFQVRFQGHDIIRTWALFTIIKSIYHLDQVPWENIVISGHALDKHGRKISKTSGNFIPPQQYLDSYGGDGLRYWAAHSLPGSDAKTDESIMQKGKKLANKLRNARRFLDLNIAQGGENTTMQATWDVSKKLIDDEFSRFNWQGAVDILSRFFWHDFCDTWIETSKKVPCFDTLNTIWFDMMPYMGIFLPHIEKELASKAKQSILSL